MYKLITIFFSALLLLISGCSSQVEKGKGGLAEHDLAGMPSHPVGLENTLFFEQQLSSRHLDTLILAGAKICFPASVRTAEIRQNRISRELQGGLETDAANDLIIQRDKLARLERRLNYVQLQGTCLPNSEVEPLQQKAMQTKQTPLSSAEITKIQSMLNNNNQFVTDSTALNPRYIGNLSEVAILLRPHPEYHLKVIGHADNTGNEAANLKLSLQRAQQVERYLQIFGLNPNNITVAGNGEKTPLFQGNEAEVRLVNRRVSIELIHAANPQQGASQ